MKRILLGLIALGMLLAWAILYFGGGSDSGTTTTASVCLRVGMVLGALWLAFPQVLGILARLPAWMMGCLGLGLLAIVRWPRSAVVVVPGMVALWMLRPRGPGRQPAKKKGSATTRKGAPTKAGGATRAGGQSPRGD